MKRRGKGKGTRVGGRGSVRRRLLAIFRRSGYIRSPDLRTRKRVGSDEYKKGWEVRFVARTREELRGLRRLLDEVGLRKGRPFRKHSRIVQPVYGRYAVKWVRARRR